MLSAFPRTRPCWNEVISSSCFEEKLKAFRIYKYPEILMLESKPSFVFLSALALSWQLRSGDSSCI